MRRRRRLLGRRRPGQRRASSRGLVARRRARLQGFLVHSGVDEFPHVDRGRPARARCRCSRGRGVPLLVHAELPDRSSAGEPATADRELPYDRYLALAARRSGRTRPSQLLIAPRAARRGCRVAHRPPLRRRGAARSSRRAQADGLPHHRRDLPALPDLRRRGDPRRRARHFKCAPPIRERANRESAVGGARRGHDRSRSSRDHSPCTPALKKLESRRLRGGLGRHRRPAARAAGGVDRRRARAAARSVGPGRAG